MPDAVLLVDDTVLIVNGAQRGFQGLKPTYASNPVRTPMLYDTTKPVGSRQVLPGDVTYGKCYRRHIWLAHAVLGAANIYAVDP